MESDSHRHSNQPILIFLLTIQKKIVSILSIILRPFLKIITFIKSNILKKENGKVSEEYIKSLICKSEEEGRVSVPAHGYDPACGSRPYYRLSHRRRRNNSDLWKKYDRKYF